MLLWGISLNMQQLCRHFRIKPPLIISDKFALFIYLPRFPQKTTLTKTHTHTYYFNSAKNSLTPTHTHKEGISYNSIAFPLIDVIPNNSTTKNNNDLFIKLNIKKKYQQEFKIKE